MLNKIWYQKASSLTSLLFFALIFLASCAPQIDLKTLHSSVSYYHNHQALAPNSSSGSVCLCQTTHVDSWPSIYQSSSNQLGNYLLPPELLTPEHNITSMPLGSTYNKNLMTPNMVADDSGYVYIITQHNDLLQIDLSSRTFVQKTHLEFLKDDHVIGLAYANDYIYVTTSRGQVGAIFSNGSEIWHVNLFYPLQSIPVVDGNAIYVVANNTVYALNVATGETLWYFQGSASNLSYAIATVPTIYQNFLIVGLSNGEIVVLRKQNGEPVAKYNSANYLSAPGSLISRAIVAPPLVVEGKILASNSSDSTFLLDTQNTTPLWQTLNIAFVNPPIICGHTFYTFDRNLTLTSSNIKDGSSNWSLQLPKLDSNFMHWYGPLLINSKILIFNSHGDIFLIDPTTGLTSSYYRLDLNLLDQLTGSYIILDKELLLLSRKNLYIIK